MGEKFSIHSGARLQHSASAAVQTERYVLGRPGTSLQTAPLADDPGRSLTFMFGANHTQSRTVGCKLAVYGDGLQPLVDRLRNDV